MSVKNKYTPEQLKAMQEPLRAELAERKLWYFVREAWPILEPGTPFVDSWHIGCVAEHLQALTELEIRKLRIHLPRRRGKSILCAVAWFCWAWIKNPWERWSYISYDAALSERDSKKCRDVIVSPWYKRYWGDRYTLKNDQNAATRFENDKQGYRLATSVGGRTIGWGGGYNIADDISNLKDAWSPTLLKKHADVWTKGVHQSVNDPLKSRFLVVMQRLNEMDLAGVIEAEDLGYDALVLPEEYEPCRVFFSKDDAKKSAERHPIIMTKIQRERPTVKYGTKEFSVRDPRNAEGELLSPERYPRWYVEEEKKSLGAYGTASQKQQRPSPLEGTIFKLNMFRYAREEWRAEKKVFVMQWHEGDQLRTRIVYFEQCRFFQTIDTAQKTKEEHDYTAIGTWVLTPQSDLILYHMWRGKVSVPYQFALLEAFRKGRAMWNEEESKVIPLQDWPRRLLFQAVEDKSSGIGLIQLGHAAGVPFKPLSADNDPMQRIAPVASMYASGQVYHMEGAAWLPDYEGEMLGFPNAAHDDMLMTAAHAGYLAQHDVILRTGLGRPLIASDEETTKEVLRLAGLENDNRVLVNVGGVNVEFDFDD